MGGNPHSKQVGGQETVFRNLAFTGDTVTVRLRQEGFASPEEYFKLCKADVIFAYFGYNESFAGQAGVAKFKSDLSAMIDKYRSIQFNGKSGPASYSSLPSPMRTSRARTFPMVPPTT